MKQFEPGMFARFPNEQIPRILDILKANGYIVDNSEIRPDDLYVVFCDFGHIGNVFASTNMENPQPYHSEISVHDFLVIALRLEEGMGILTTQSTSIQRMTIISELEKLGVNQHSTTSTRIEKSVFEDSFYFDGNMFISTRAFGIITKPIHPSDWCRRLCVETIGTISKMETVEKTLEQHVDEYDAAKFDPTKPFEYLSVRGWFQGEHYIGADIDGAHVIRDENDNITWAKCVRNIPEFNASMLEVGESMLTEEGDDGKRNLITKLLGGNYIDLFNLNGFPLGEDVVGTITGRKVQVEIKIVEP